MRPTRSGCRWTCVWTRRLKDYGHQDMMRWRGAAGQISIRLQSDLQSIQSRHEIALLFGNVLVIVVHLVMEKDTNEKTGRTWGNRGHFTRRLIQFRCGLIHVDVGNSGGLNFDVEIAQPLQFQLAEFCADRIPEERFLQIGRISVILEHKCTTNFHASLLPVSMSHSPPQFQVLLMESQPRCALSTMGVPLNSGNTHNVAANSRPGRHPKMPYRVKDGEGIPFVGQPSMSRKVQVWLEG